MSCILQAHARWIRRCVLLTTNMHFVGLSDDMEVIVRSTSYVTAYIVWMPTMVHVHSTSDSPERSHGKQGTQSRTSAHLNIFKQVE